MSTKVEVLIKAYVRMRDALGVKRKEFKEYEASMKKDLEKIELSIKKLSDELGVES